MKQYTFKDGFKCVASTTKEAIAKHRAMAACKINPTDEADKVANDLGYKTMWSDAEDGVLLIYHNSGKDIVKTANYKKLCSKLNDIHGLKYVIDDNDPACIAVWNRVMHGGSSKATAKTLSEIEKELAKASKMYLDRIAKAFKVKVAYDNKVTIDNYTIIPLSTSPDLFAIRNVTRKNVIHNIFIGTHKEVIEWLKEKLNKKVTAKFSPDEKSRLEKCLELLEKQCAICGLKLYFDLDNEKEYVNVYLKPDKKNVYLTVNVGGDSTATAMYDIWKTIYPKI